MLFRNADYIVTQNSDREVLVDRSVRVKDGRFTGIGEDLEPREGEEVVDCTGRILVPGLVNAHTHLPMTVLRGISDDKELEPWLEEDIFPAEAEMTPGDRSEGARLGLEEMAMTGTTSFNDMYVPGDVLEEVRGSGMRGFLGLGLLDVDSTPEEQLREARRSLEMVGQTGKTAPVVAPHSTYACSKELVKKSWELACERDLKHHIHVSETVEENRRVRQSTGSRPVEVLEELDALGGRSLLAHCVHLEEREKDIIADSGATVVHNPCANLKLGSGTADVPDLLERGVNVALGTDGPASNNSYNMFEEMKFAALVQKENDPGALTAQQALDMATVNGAEALGIDAGRIADGVRADFCTVRTDLPSMKPVNEPGDVVSHLVYSFEGRVERSYVEGEKVWEA